MEDRVVFNLSHDFNTLGLLQGVESFAIRGKSYSFNFLHLSIQELLAAIYIATKLDDEEKTEQFKKLFGQPRFAAVFQFFSAKTKLKTTGINEIVKQVASSNNRPLLISLINCLFEAQDPSLHQLVVHELGLGLNLSETNIYPADCYCLSHFLTHCKGFSLRISTTHIIGDDHCKVLFQEGQVYDLVDLNLKNNNNIGDEGAVAIAKAMKLMLNIKRLVIYSNNIGDVGRAALMEAAQLRGAEVVL